MKVLTVYQYGILGGVVAQLRNRLEALGDRVEMHFAFLEDLGAASAFPPGTPVHFLRSPEALTDLLRSEPFDVIVNIDTPGAYPAILAAEPAAPILHEVHTTYTFIDYLWSLTQDPPMDALLAPSAYLRARLLHEFGFEGVRPVHVVPNVLDTARFDYREPARVPERPVILWVGKLDAHKNWRDALAIAAAAVARRPCELWMVGGYTAPEETVTPVLRLATRLEIFDCLRWIQRVDYPAMPCFYSMAAASGGCLLITSKDESFGMAAVEAMACRCPVVASRVGALPEVLDGPHQAGLYSLHHVEAAAARVASLLDDPSEREALAEQGRRKVCERYSLQVAGETYLRVLASLKRGGSGP